VKAENPETVRSVHMSLYYKERDNPFSQPSMKYGLQQGVVGLAVTLLTESQWRAMSTHREVETNEPIALR
jgi:hypothetical protein